MINETDLEAKILEFGTRIIEDMQKRAPQFNFRSAENALMNWALENEDLKINLFRLVDTLPSLHSASDVAKHIKEYFAEQKELATPIRLAAALSSSTVLSPFVAFAAKTQVANQSKRFIAGNTPNKALGALKKLRKSGLSFTIDLLGEAALSEEESKVYSERYLELIQTLKDINPEWIKKYPVKPEHPGDQTLVNVSIKLSSLYSQTRAIDFENSVKILSDRLTKLFREVKAANGVAYVDMEDCSLTDITIDVFKRVLEKEEFVDYPGFGLVLQAYLKRTHEDVTQFIEWARSKRKAETKIRLVKGAYWDSEYIMSKQRDWPCPVFTKKEHSDANYEKITRLLLNSTDVIYPAFASHNIRSVSHAINYAESVGVPKTKYEIQFLFGMGDEFKECLSEYGYLTRDYTPIGELLPGMAYLVRRLLENTANEGFLRQINFDKIDPYLLLKKPNELIES